MREGKRLFAFLDDVHVVTPLASCLLLFRSCEAGCQHPCAHGHDQGVETQEGSAHELAKFSSRRSPTQQAAPCTISERVRFANFVAAHLRNW